MQAKFEHDFEEVDYWDVKAFEDFPDDISEDVKSQTSGKTYESMDAMVAKAHMSLSVFASKVGHKLTRQEIWEQRNPSIQAVVYDPSGNLFEIRKVANNKGQLACWDQAQNKLVYAHKNKDGSYNVGKITCTKERPELSGNTCLSEPRL